jgi:hypothetical protein
MPADQLSIPSLGVPIYRSRAVGPPTRVLGDVGLGTCTGMWGCHGCTRVTLDWDVQWLLLDQMIFG